MKTRYAIVCQGSVIGHSDFAHVVANGMRMGFFFEAEGYEAVRDYFRTSLAAVFESTGEESPAPEQIQKGLRAQQAEQARMGLTVLDALGQPLVTRFIQIADAAPLDPNAIVPPLIFISALFEGFPEVG